jgi:hypothetical protein
VEESLRLDRGSCSPIVIVNDCGAMIKPAGENPDDQGVEEAAEHAERAVEHRQETQRRAVQAKAEDGPSAHALERESAEHAQAAHAEEDGAQEAAERAGAQE